MKERPAPYFWKDGQIIQMEVPLTWPALIETGLSDVLSVHPNESPMHNRSGYYSASEKRWKYTPVHQLPAEFRLQLLLLGVPT